MQLTLEARAVASSKHPVAFKLFTTVRGEVPKNKTERHHALTQALVTYLAAAPNFGPTLTLDLHGLTVKEGQDELKVPLLTLLQKLDRVATHGQLGAHWEAGVLKLDYLHGTFLVS